MKIAKWLASIVVLALLVWAIFAGRAHLDRLGAEQAAAQPYPPTAVVTAIAENARWEQHHRAVGSLRAVEGTHITAQVAGNVTAIGFESGTRVGKGQFLLQLDNSTQLAQLHADQATLAQARADLERRRKLYRNRSVSLEEVQHAQMRVDVARAAVDNDQAVLAKLRISAPFSGVLGIREVSLGEYVTPGTAIVNLQRWDPLLLDFSLPQHLLPQVRIGQEVGFEVDAYPGRVFAGRLSALGAEIDPDTRNLKAQATLANGEETLRPGLFGHVSLNIGTSLEGVAVPSTAIAYSTFGNSVFVVSADDQGTPRAHARVVHILAERDGFSLVDAGDLAAGSEVVAIGQHKLRDGMAVSASAPAGDDGQ